MDAPEEPPSDSRKTKKQAGAPRTTTGWDTVAAGIEALKEVFLVLIDRGQATIMLAMVILLGIIAIVLTLAWRVPDVEALAILAAVSGGLWKLATVVCAVAAIFVFYACKVRGRDMQREMDRIAEEKKELQAGITTVRLETSSSLDEIRASRRKKALNPPDAGISGEQK